MVVAREDLLEDQCSLLEHEEAQLPLSVVQKAVAEHFQSAEIGDHLAQPLNQSLVDHWSSIHLEPYMVAQSDQ